MLFNNIERRRHQRYDFFCTIEYVLNPDITGEIFKGAAINISNSGLCFCISNPLSEGQEIIIKSNLPVSSQTASVCWIEKGYDDFYKVGLMFV
jgi:hypothetical protein